MNKLPKVFYDPTVVIGCLLVALLLVGIKADQYRDTGSATEIRLRITEERLQLYDQTLREAQRLIVKLKAEIESLKAADNATQ
ncbi:hypothetical protein FQ775_09145 [Nitratireductor mangrovi]|uniref:Uncharacterized protein n=1 Tax=Nitratireductor mangrovi TaxID=2599600 RepID=A0A5B8KY47_9HYPH|nr:hypothetical protein [Nitratireductor mangrovi]QDZ00533.1 hypothetical protein FQ775_09145 [Nitratireductor mangrovi]